MSNKVVNNKIDFAIIIGVKHANPNGDPLNGNRPRQTYDGFGEISDVCIKRKLRNRLLAMGESIFVQSDDNRNDDCRSLNDRFKKVSTGNNQFKTAIREAVCDAWYDVRAFGQVFAFKKGSGKSDDGDAGAVSIGIRGPVTVQSAYSVEPVTIDSMQIVKSVNLETNTKNPDVKASDTMGMKHRVSKGVYVSYGSVNTQLAQKTGFSEDDAEMLQKALRSMFENDVSSARPEGSMEVMKVIWWKHSCASGDYSSAKIFKTLKVEADGTYSIAQLDGIAPMELDQLEGAELANSVKRQN